LGSDVRMMCIQN